MARELITTNENNQRELDVHAQCERRRQDVLSDKELTDSTFDLAFYL
jgi:hypothetical protein